MEARFFKIYLPDLPGGATNICVYTFDEDPENTVYYFLDDGEDRISIEQAIDEIIESGEGKWEELSADEMKEMYHGDYAEKVNGVVILAKAATKFGVDWDWVNEYINKQNRYVRLNEIENYEIVHNGKYVALYINEKLIDEYENDGIIK